MTPRRTLAHVTLPISAVPDKTFFVTAAGSSGFYRLGSGLSIGRERHPNGFPVFSVARPTIAYQGCIVPPRYGVPWNRLVGCMLLPVDIPRILDGLCVLLHVCGLHGVHHVALHGGLNRHTGRLGSLAEIRSPDVQFPGPGEVRL